ncbi:MAG TPA: hypothetical protein VG101_19510 [Puia sp.]|nr:hypothetical protein [Puia sp.]
MSWFESRLGNLTGQVEKNVACPVFIFPESLVQAVDQLYRLVEPSGSINFAVKSQFFRKDRTDQLPFFYNRTFLVDFVKISQVVYRLVNQGFDICFVFFYLVQPGLQDNDLLFAFSFDGFEVQGVDIAGQ